MFALIDGTNVVDVAAETFPVAPALAWAECDANVSVGYSFSNGVFSPPAAVITHDLALDILENEFQRRLKAVSFNGRSFDLSGDNKDFVNDWRDGAVETDALLGTGTWGPETWPHMSDGLGGYALADADACRVWALSMFIMYAGIYKARNSHAAAIKAETNMSTLQDYDCTVGWP